MTVLIRAAAAGDASEWRRLWDGYCRFYEAEVSAETTDETWRRLLDPASPILGRIAEIDGAVVGFANAVIHLGTWNPAPVCYLEDLFVDGSVRGKGIGRALIDDLLAMARREGWSDLYWQTRADNAVARRLYDTYAPADGFVRYRLEIA